MQAPERKSSGCTPRRHRPEGTNPSEWAKYLIKDTAKYEQATYEVMSAIHDLESGKFIVYDNPFAGGVLEGTESVRVLTEHNQWGVRQLKDMYRDPDQSSAWLFALRLRLYMAFGADMRRRGDEGTMEALHKDLPPRNSARL